MEHLTRMSLIEHTEQVGEREDSICDRRMDVDIEGRAYRRVAIP